MAGKWLATDWQVIDEWLANGTKSQEQTGSGCGSRTSVALSH